MLPNYYDIRSRIQDEPLWFDEQGVPRYDAFKPTMLGVYDKFAILVEIACQGCQAVFSVGLGQPSYDVFMSPDGTWQSKFNSLEGMVTGFHFGDPPSHGGCVGETMNCIDRRIVEAWEQEKEHYKWVRRADLEQDIPDYLVARGIIEANGEVAAERVGRVGGLAAGGVGV